MIAMLHTISASNSAEGNSVAPLGDCWIIQLISGNASRPSAPVPVSALSVCSKR